MLHSSDDNRLSWLSSCLRGGAQPDIECKGSSLRGS
ncbi:hypothetical protein HaLaN_29855 [Haematococcus lacustris]|uniref:Uncharacterized protein n=1 Tax=Haematococcus lacustris TaxID=44745 RepID=A0A6A0AGD8_HAELA|nr:hypothetical protein HaLaN_29855 [Haematococcus lacustris]